MTEKLKLTKDSLSRERKALARFRRFLPTLKLRKTQLLNEMNRIRRDVAERETQLRVLLDDVAQWAGVYAERPDLRSLCAPEALVTKTENVAGIQIPVFVTVRFRESDYDLMTHPFWIDAGLRTMKETITRKLELTVLREQLTVIGAELSTTVQRINLFEKVKIPRTEENIRRIGIFLGDQQTAGVVRGKLTKGKLTRKRKLRSAVPIRGTVPN